MEKKSPNKKRTDTDGKNCNAASCDKSAKAGKKAQETTREFTDAFSLNRDPFGSYTGRPKDNGGLEQPVQDADDL